MKFSHTYNLEGLISSLKFVLSDYTLVLQPEKLKINVGMSDLPG
jgi:hypothetical protein